ncbi:MAG TPA: HAD-IIIA family hydrolase, partial [Cyclobacteriaceae bacterium]|nr:HAD-IIIA family hydrolase [Cyclobacteriaceae bacterium]
MALKNKCVFLDRDGVLNEDRPDYSYHLEHFRVLPGVPLALRQLKNAGYLLIVVTNQSGISKGVYTQQDMEACHDYLQQVCGG